MSHGPSGLSDSASRDQGGTSYCPLCQAVNGIACNQGDINANTILLDTNAFIVVPALGPLVLGHALAITKSHSLGLDYLNTSVKASYDKLSARLRRYCERRCGNLLEAEHGGPSFERRGPCI